MKIVRKAGFLCLGAALFPTVPVQAQNNIVFLDGGYSELCAQLASRQERARDVNVTGSRLDQPPLAICTRAVNEERGSPRHNAGNYNNRGVLYFAEGNYVAAQADFEAAIRAAPELAEAHANLGYVLVAQRRWADAIVPLTGGIDLGAPELHKVHYNRGVAYEETGQVAEAYRDYVKASELAPDWEEPKTELSRFTVR